MKHIKRYVALNENLNRPLTIGQYLEEIRIPEEKRDQLIRWWNENLEGVQIHYFPFATRNPILGGSLGEDGVAVNSSMAFVPTLDKLFIVLHEAAHCLQHVNDNFMQRYWDPVVAGNIEAFKRGYREVEEEANTFALEALMNTGFRDEAVRGETGFRQNERMAETVYRMMRRDIEKFRPTDFFELLKMQIL